MQCTDSVAVHIYLISSIFIGFLGFQWGEFGSKRGESETNSGESGSNCFTFYPELLKFTG